MSTVSNTVYNYSKLFTGAAVLFAGITISDANSDDVELNLIQPVSSHIFTQDFSSQSTSRSFLKNTLEISKSLEIENIKKIISEKYNTKVLSTWIPADGYFDKVCLFISLENQENLNTQYENLELEIYQTLKLDIEKSQFFNMVALV